MTAREAFKAGFLARCVDSGLDAAGASALAKQAAEKLAGVADVAGHVAGTVTGLGVPLALAAPVLLGGATGYGVARATDVDSTDVGEIKKRELLDTYRRETEKARRLKEVRDYHAARQRTGRMFV